MTRDTGTLVLGSEWFDERPGGLNRYVRDLSAALDAAGHPHRVVVVGPAASAPDPFVGTTPPDAPLPRRLLAFTRRARRLWSSADVVDVHFALYAALPVLLGRRRRPPVVVHFHGPWAEESLVARPAARAAARLKGLVERFVYRNAEEVIVLSESFAGVVERRYGVEPWRVHVVPPAVDLDRFRPADRDAARRRIAVPTAAFVAVVARRLEARMGVDVLLDAWADVVRARPDARLVVVGTGTEADRLEQRAAHLEIADSVRFVGRLSDEDLVAAYQAADVSVVPTLSHEGFGLVVLESLATGTPVIVTDVGGLPESVRGLDGATIVPAGRVDALADALVRAAAGDVPSPEACRRHAERFSFGALAERHRSIYQRIGGRRRRVAFVDHCAQRSGGELALARLIPALDVEADVILGEPGPLETMLEDAGARVVVDPLDGGLGDVRKDDIRPGRLPLRQLGAAAASVWRLRRELRRRRPDIVHTNSLKAALYGGIAGRLAGVRVVWHVRDRISEDYLPGPAVRLVRLAARIVPHGILANSETTLATLGAVSVPTAVVPSPLDGLPPQRRRRVAPRPLVVCIVGRLAPWKGQHVFIDAFAEAFEPDEASAIVVGGALFGEDDYADQLRAQVDEHGLADRVTFTGHVDDVATVLRSVDVLVHASTSPEPFGQVVVEGMAAGCAVIASDAGGPAETIEDGVTGLLHDPGDVTDLARCLRRLADDGELRARLGDAGHHRARDFLPERIAPRVAQFYDVVLGVD